MDDLDHTPPDADAMRRALAIIDALPDAYRPTDSVPLREALPGIWPTIGDLRALLVESGRDQPRSPT